MLSLSSSHTDILPPTIHDVIFARDMSGLNGLLKENEHLAASEDIEGNYPIHTAVINWSEAIPVLVNAGAKMDQKNSGGFTPLALAAYRRKSDAIFALLNLGADINDLGEDYCNIACHVISSPAEDAQHTIDSLEQSEADREALVQAIKDWRAKKLVEAHPISVADAPLPALSSASQSSSFSGVDAAPTPPLSRMPSWSTAHDLSSSIDADAESASDSSSAAKPTAIESPSDYIRPWQSPVASPEPDTRQATAGRKRKRAEISEDAVDSQAAAGNIVATAAPLPKPTAAEETAAAAKPALLLATSAAASTEMTTAATTSTQAAT